LFLPGDQNKDAASRRFLLMSFKRHQEIYPNNRGVDHGADASAHRLDEFPTGYSLTGCSPALPASASPVGAEHAASSAQLRGSSRTKNLGENLTKIAGSGSTLMDPFFCPNNGVHLKAMLLCDVKTCVRRKPNFD